MSLIPTRPTALPVRIVAWLNLIGNLAIIGTGGAVRLTGSGLGCPTWPLCTEDSLVNTPEMGIHGVIEFSNRTLSGVLGVLALLLVVVTWRFASMRILAFVVLGGVIAQAVVGGITVLTGLNSWIVGFHYLASIALVAVTTAIVLRAHRGLGAKERFLPGWMTITTHITTVLLVLTMSLGVVTTGSGPHSGDESALRNGLAWDVLAHIHAYAGYALVAALFVTLVGAIRAGERRFLVAVLVVIGVVGVQILVGIAQANLALPPLLVGIHMVLAGIAVALTVVLVDASRRLIPVPASPVGI